MTLLRAVSTVSDLTVLDAGGTILSSPVRPPARLARTCERHGGGRGPGRGLCDGWTVWRDFTVGEDGAVSALMGAISDHVSIREWVWPAPSSRHMPPPVSAEPMSAARAPDDVGDFLALMPIYLLPISAELKSALARFGMRVIGDVSSVGQTAMFDRFGREGIVRMGALNRSGQQTVHSHGSRGVHSSSIRRCRFPQPRWRWRVWAWTCCSGVRSQGPR